VRITDSTTGVTIPKICDGDFVRDLRAGVLQPDGEGLGCGLKDIIRHGVGVYRIEDGVEMMLLLIRDKVRGRASESEIEH
jgi:hypothetical protein